MRQDYSEERLGQQLPHLNAEELAELRDAIECLVHVLRPERIYAFGSQARGTPASDSDVDLLVVVPESDLPPYRLAQIAYRAVSPHLKPLDIIVMTRGEFDSRKPARASLPATVLREGRLLYAS